MTADARELPDQDDLLRQSAPLAWRVAPVLCRPDDAARANCAWYHGFWQYLRLLGVASSPQRHSAFFAEALRAALARCPSRRIVITGSADYAMLGQVIDSAGVQGDAAHVTVVDACDTPLFLCKWYAKLCGQSLSTLATDILRWEPSEAYDIACTHSLISQVPAVRRKELIAAWRRMLKPGGRVVTTVRINPDWTPERAGFNREQVAAFRDTAVQRGQALVPALDIAVDELARAAEVYAERIVTHSITSGDELTALFETGGFRMERFDLRTIGGNVSSGLAGPTTSKSGTYAELVAVRI
jgi:hypothetical protein